jgi:hypothetical protein
VLNEFALKFLRIPDGKKSNSREIYYRKGKNEHYMFPPLKHKQGDVQKALNIILWLNSEKACQVGR